MYRASADGFSGKNFHFKCDKIENTLTVIKSESGNVFGGYTEKAWTSNKQYDRDSNAFLFSLINKEDKPFKVACSDSGKDAILCYSTYGPTFGRVSCDLHIADNSNKYRDCFSYFSNTYKHPHFPVGTEKAKNILAGSHRFKTTEIEVYSKVNKL